MYMKRLAIILSLVSLLIGSAVSPAYSVQDKCLTTKKFKEVDSRTFLMMKKNLSKYTNQAFVLRGDIYSFRQEEYFTAFWFGKGADFPITISFEAIGSDVSKNQKRISKLAQGDSIKAKVIVISAGDASNYPLFSVCSATVIKSTY